MLRFDEVGLAFRGGDGVRDLSFDVDSGEIVALVGLNGAGKTTLMRLALGMLRADSGTVQVLGRPLDDLPVAAWSAVGALIEVPLAYPELTARENLRIACQLRGADPAAVPSALDAWLLSPVADRRFLRLSLGTRQRVGLAAAMQHDPRLIVLDEPGNALDPASVILLREQLLRRAGEGAAVLVSSHHLDEVARIADRVILMNRGRLIGELDTAGADLERMFFDRIRVDDERREAVLR
ncbi:MULTISPECIES: ABC transporter ATP-binding protein [unclassified Microbacterium]|uniref:ABC transporter ATP-binding protein n=1 Tax=unclassified Microbacterium TaxID=2609290 RepID=UPI0012F8A9F7|nr:ABC transporter ATP-binding protein [Microbacterium sp. MAH-37]MVQ40563.1 ATP-binding cassette domain-containing protein [Microbacterium sp. MAH-37]